MKNCGTRMFTEGNAEMARRVRFCHFLVSLSRFGTTFV